MGLWAAIKHTINSTLGTPDFMPLDKMISNQSRLVASEELYAALSDFTVSQSPQDSTASGEGVYADYPKKIKMVRPGTAYLKGTYVRSRVDDTNVEFTVYKNNEEIYSWSRMWNAGSGSETFSLNIEFVPNDVFSFKLYVCNVSDSDTRSASFSIEDFTINGTVKQNVFIEQVVEVID